MNLPEAAKENLKKAVRKVRFQPGF